LRKVALGFDVTFREKYAIPTTARQFRLARYVYFACEGRDRFR